MTTAIPIVRQANEGEKLWFAGGGVFTFKATAAETAESFTMVEDRVARGKTTPLHLHPEIDETIYVLDGELVVDMDGTQQVVGAGGLFVAPRGVAHAFLVTSESAHLLVIQVPGTAESFYREAGDSVESDADASKPADFDRLRAVAERSHTIELLGPPPFSVPSPA